MSKYDQNLGAEKVDFTKIIDELFNSFFIILHTFYILEKSTNYRKRITWR